MYPLELQVQEALIQMQWTGNKYSQRRQTVQLQQRGFLISCILKENEAKSTEV
jgi:hypothetical protein